jgi:hypothetical protein
MRFDIVTVFMLDGGAVCDPFDKDVYVFASFSPGGSIIEYGYVSCEVCGVSGARSMVRHGLDVVTVDTPINDIDDVRAALDHVV